MKILYNTQTQQIEGKPYEGVFSNIYNSGLNETIGWLPEYIVQLTVIDNEATYDPATQNGSSVRIVDLPNLEYRWEHTITDKTDKEIIEELNQQAEQLDRQLKDEELTKLVEHKVNETRGLLAIITDEEALNLKQKYKPYKVPMTLQTGERFYYPHNDRLYKVIGTEGVEHTTQLNWKPDTAVSLYVEVTPPGVIVNWKQPTGAHDAYQLNDKVNHNDFTWESTAENNTWEPGVYGWEKI